MRGIIDYIFRPSTHDKEVEKSIYKGMARTTHAMVMFTMAFVFAFFIWTFLEPSAFDNSLPLHRILYLTFLMTGCFWIVLMRYASKDFDTRYKVMKFLSPFLGVMMYALCIALSFVNVHFNDYIDTTIFLAVSLIG
ncbi:MAG: hypothetical protein J5607_03855, partial [Clostridiales bacterium]|nr:hypothetical protein [Clostridiales bacterium]